MSKQELWFGVLEAGEKSSPVVRSQKLNTGKPQTIYLYNQNRNEIIEYKTEIVESKLRKLNNKEQDIEKELTTAFKKVLKDFTPRAKPSAVETTTPAKSASTPPAKKPVPEQDLNIDQNEEFEAELVEDEE